MSFRTKEYSRLLVVGCNFLVDGLAVKSPYLQMGKKKSFVATSSRGTTKSTGLVVELLSQPVQPCQWPNNRTGQERGPAYLKHWIYWKEVLVPLWIKGMTPWISMFIILQCEYKRFITLCCLLLKSISYFRMRKCYYGMLAERRNSFNYAKCRG